MLKIEIKDSAIHSNSVNGKNGQWTARSQAAVMDLPNGERRVLRVRLGPNQAGYAPGVYTLADSSFKVSEYGDLQIQYLNLEPLRAGQAPPQARAV